MKKSLVIILVLVIFIQILPINAQEPASLDMELEVSDEQRIAIFLGFIIGVIAIFLYLARDIILKRKTEYEEKDLDSKKNKDYEKYHSDWSDDYEEFGSRNYTKEDKEFKEASENSTLPNYYEILGVKKTATPQEIKSRYRELAKKFHPDRTRKDETKEAMSEINKAYEILSNEELKTRYDKYFA